MLRKWRLLRTVVTIVMTLLGAGLVALAWFSIGTVSGEAAVDLAIFGLVLPFGFYAVFTLAGWQRSLAAGAVPSRFIGACLRYRLGMMAPVLFMFLLLGLMENGIQALDRQPGSRTIASSDGGRGFDAVGFRRGCVTGLTNSIRSRGDNPAAMSSRIDGLCGCMTIGMQTAFSENEIEAWVAKQDRFDDPKYTHLVRQCQASNT